MSVELHIFLRDETVPNREGWVQAIDSLGFPVALDPMLDVRTHTGFLPVTYSDKKTGFEFQLEPAVDILSTYPGIAAQVGDRDKCASFRWGGDLDELAAAISCAAALTLVADGIYYYPNDGILYGADEAVAATRRDLESL
jgi:hypothetical protein